MTALIKYDAARHALQEARTVDEVKEVKDKAEALRLYAQQANDRDLEVWTAEIKARAARRIGELSAALDTAHKVGQGTKVQLPTGGKLKSAALKAAGISTSAAQRYEQVAAMPQQQFDEVIAERAAAHAPVTVAALLSASKPPTAPAAKKEPPPAQPPKIDKRDARIAELEADLVALRDEITQVREGAAEAVDAYETSQAIIAEKKDGSLVADLRRQVAQLTRDRDSAQNRAVALQKHLGSVERRLAKYEKAAA